ncbi:MAG TPA: UbiA family prenyltransferase [Rectinemataceae bacterium]|nr:UbiA family prenyltransferase [Rectinemataceae bacterium]
MADVRARQSIGFKQFFGLSRMSHSVLDIAHPAVGAALASVILGGAPPARTIVMGLIAAFAGYTSVFALNDVIDLKVDREKMAKYRDSRETFDLDSMGERHPLAQGSLRFGAGLAWVLAWGLLSLVLAYLLRPICALLLLAAVILEAAYCLLLRVTHWKSLLSGLMVGVGGLAGVWAVSPSPRLGMVLVFFAWAFTWEVGGRNIPNDWSDLEEDRHLGIRTVPVRYGQKNAMIISLAIGGAMAILGLLFPLVSPIPHAWAYLAAVLLVSVIFLLLPAIRWLREQTSASALAFFNMACFYPLVVFAMLAVSVLA